MEDEIKEAFKSKTTLKSVIVITKAMGGITLLVSFGTAVVRLSVFIWNLGG